MLNILAMLAASGFARTGQDLDVPMGRFTGAATGTLTGTLQSDAMLREPVIQASQPGLVEHKLNGVSLNASDKGMDIAAFDPAALLGEFGDFGLPLAQALSCTAEVTLDAAGTAVASWGSDPWEGNGEPPEAIALPPEVIKAYFGLGTVTVPAAGTATLTATAKTAVALGLLGLSKSGLAADTDVVVTNITYNNGVPLLNGTGNTPVGQFAWTNHNLASRILRHGIGLQQDLTIHLQNFDGVNAAEVKGGVFTLSPAQLRAIAAEIKRMKAAS